MSAIVPRTSPIHTCMCFVFVFGANAPVAAPPLHALPDSHGLDGRAQLCTVHVFCPTCAAHTYGSLRTHDTSSRLLTCWAQDGDTPLHLAAAAGHLGIIEDLLRAGADLGCRGKVGAG